MSRPPSIDPNCIAVFTGAGISAESGLKTFRGSDGLWENFRIEEVATPEGWARDPAKVLAFYNARRRGVAAAQPNAAHQAIARLEERFRVIVITQNIDDLHERAGSTEVIHLHGTIVQARSSIDHHYRTDYPLDGLSLDDRCPLGGALRPNVVWFGEAVENLEIAAKHLAMAGRVLVIGTSLTVFPAAGLVSAASFGAEKTIVAQELDHCPRGYRFLRGKAGEIVPTLVRQWLSTRSP